jgi:hypothetical protein
MIYVQEGQIMRSVLACNHIIDVQLASSRFMCEVQAIAAGKLKRHFLWSQ